MEKYFEFAIQNVARHGDTDVFPFPIENYIFYDKPKEAVDILKGIHSNFEQATNDYPPLHVKALSVAGYSGFRPASQLDPIWNAYLLALVCSVAEEIEKARVQADKNIVFSYRIKLNFTDFTLFDTGIGWHEYQLHSQESAKKHKFVLTCDISDFYPRIYHHRLENALKKARSSSDTVSRIMRLLSKFSDGVSYGLPIGGNAARILSELVLNRIDRLLITHGITYCRYVDDFRIFTESQEDAYNALLYLSEILLSNEGLTLQKAKTRLMGNEEYVSTSTFAEETHAGTELPETQKFLNLKLRFDPYSPTAEDDYEELKKELKKYDVVGMLTRELRKTRIDESLTRKLVKSIKYLSPTPRNQAILSLLDSLSTLYPLFTVVMMTLKSTLDDLEEETRVKVFHKLRELIHLKSYIALAPTNLAFALRVLAHDKSEECDLLLASLFETVSHPVIRRDIILIMAQRNADYWISNCRKNYCALSPWEGRALLIASYILEDEGRHWRDDIKKGLAPLDKLALDWAAEKKKSGTWNLPL
jgi:DNA-binding transcriptional ArsR family regulator